VIEDEEALLVVQDWVVVSEALVVPHVVERIPNRNPRLQNPHGHLGFEMAIAPEALHVLPE
jgi:hypothetical protein